MKLIIQAQYFNAVNACSGVDDVRYYLNTFYLDISEKRIVGTNGHILAYAPIEIDEGSGNANSVLFQAFRKPLMKSEDHMLLDTEDKTLSGVNQYDLEVVDGKFPDYEKVLAGNDNQPCNTFAFNAEYLARIARWSHQQNGQCQLVFGETNLHAARVIFPKLPDLHVTLMPCRF